jgi:hypothetical protein
LSQALLKNNSSNVVLVRESASEKAAVSTFDYSDLNAYLLVVVGLAKPDEDLVMLYSEIAQKAQSQKPIALREIQPICRKNQLVNLPADSTLDKAVEVLGSGIHRILVTNRVSEVVGILSQLRLVEFFWNEAVSFPTIDRLYGAPLRDLHVGTHQIIAIKSFSTSPS